MNTQASPKLCAWIHCRDTLLTCPIINIASERAVLENYKQCETRGWSIPHKSLERFASLSKVSPGGGEELNNNQITLIKENTASDNSRAPIS